MNFLYAFIAVGNNPMAGKQARGNGTCVMERNFIAVHPMVEHGVAFFRHKGDVHFNVYARSVLFWCGSHVVVSFKVAAALASNTNSAKLKASGRVVGLTPAASMSAAVK